MDNPEIALCIHFFPLKYLNPTSPPFTSKESPCQTPEVFLVLPDEVSLNASSPGLRSSWMPEIPPQWVAWKFFLNKFSPPPPKKK